MNCRMTSLSTTMMQKMMRRFRTFALVLCASLFAALSAAASSAIPARPNPPRLVNDLVGIFTPMQTASLETMLVNFDDSTSNQIAVVTVNDLGGYEVADFAREIGVGWGVGSSDFNNGIVVLVKPKTEGSGGEVTIQVGYGLEGAIPDAECWAIIRDITRHMTDIFTEEFAKINTYFGQTFTEMFGGGKGSLELEDPAEPLTCGIEIKVQPPGKQLKTITLLSGGEKAFVAIALYFAILKVRPTPFCMLDEIDAALDDRNVERYASYLRQLCKKTQFIVITHRRGTMEEADALFGVTMQEQGVSKILHLDLNQLTEQLGITE